VLSILLALGSAFANAVNLVTQHVASTAAPAKEKGWRLALYLVRNPLWLFGVGAMVASFVLQALALYRGRISVVQSVLVSELVFSLVIGRVWLRRAVPPAAWAAASVTAAGLAIFLVMSEPKGGHTSATTAAWLPALLTFGGLATGFAVIARGATPIGKAAFYACAAGITGALFATFVKSATEVLGHQGVSATLQQGTLYGLIIVGVVGTILTQAALHYGPLAVSQPLMLIVNPVVSIALGIWLFGEHFEGGWWKVAIGGLGFAVMAAGVVVLARTAPSLASTPAEI
jgi:hypothetical protein